MCSVLPCSNQFLSVTQSGSQDLWASGLSGPKPVLPAGLCVPPISARVSAIGGSPNRGIPAGHRCLPLHTSPKNLPGHGQHMTRSVGRQGPAAACLVTVGSSCRKNPCLHTGSYASSCFRTGWGLSAAEEGREELHMQGGAGDKRTQLLLGEVRQALFLHCLFSTA